ncbi:hypothetical protein Glove_326g72 [Diversispora epigaea]|uniref:Peptide hydrolase n=1 Tax=Diversispora epigaea TaxID=1348612 RepID=A0A397HLY2_9GLOM|nr:hypothetical protein Glove_326g72 [Diversispora epigaea]
MTIKIILIIYLILFYCQLPLAYKTLSKQGLKILTNITFTESLETFSNYLTPILIPRVPDTDGNRKVQNFIKEHFNKLKWDIDEDTFTDETPLGKKQFNNIIVTKNIKSNKRLVMAAHFDSKYFDPPNNFVGATDSAVPCAILMDLASKLDPYLKDKDKVTLQIIFFDGEEAFKSWNSNDSLYGARHLASKWENTYLDIPEVKTRNVLGSIEVLVLLDLLGATKPSFQSYFQTTSWMFSELANIENRLYTEKIITIPEDIDDFDDISYFDTSTIHNYQSHIEDDHLPFLKRGVSILHIIAYPFPSVWHTFDDNLDAIDENVVFNLNTIFRIFAAEFLNIDPGSLTHDELV